MTKSAKRALDAIDYRARSPKRRKLSKPNIQPDSSGQQEVWSVRAILDEKKQGRGIKYLLDWTPNSATGETYHPTWVRKQVPRVW
jgi:hypothetical protein